MNHSCINCKYIYEPTSIGDFYNNTLRIPDSDWSDPVLNHLYWLCQNTNNSPINFVNGKPVLRECEDFNSYGTCPFFETSDAENIKPISFSIKEPESAIYEGDEVILSALPEPVPVPENKPDVIEPDTPVTKETPLDGESSTEPDSPTDPQIDPEPEPEPEPFPPAQILSFKYQWYKDGRKLFKEKSPNLSVDTKKIGVSYYHCIITEYMSDNGDGGIKNANVKTNSIEINVLEKVTPEPEPIPPEPVPGA